MQLHLINCWSCNLVPPLRKFISKIMYSLTCTYIGKKECTVLTNLSISKHNVEYSLTYSSSKKECTALTNCTSSKKNVQYSLTCTSTKKNVQYSLTFYGNQQKNNVQYSLTVHPQKKNVQYSLTYQSANIM